MSLMNENELYWPGMFTHVIVAVQQDTDNKE